MAITPDPHMVQKLILQLLNDGPSRGLNVRPSADLSRYLGAVGDSAYPHMPAAGRVPEDYSTSNVTEIVPPTRGRVEQATYGRTEQAPPPISQDPWFEEQLQDLPPDIFLQSRGAGEFDNAPPNLYSMEGRELDPQTVMADLMGAPPRRLAMGPELSIWGTKNGRRIRLDGPFRDELEAQRALNELRARSNNPDWLLEIGPSE